MSYKDLENFNPNNPNVFDRVFKSYMHGVSVLQDTDFAISKNDDFYKKIERDAKIGSLWQTRRQSVVNADYEVFSESGKHNDAAKVVKDMIDDIYDRETFIEDLTEAVLQGVTFQEIIWAPRDGFLAPEIIEKKSKEYFTYNRHLDDNNNAIGFCYRGDRRQHYPGKPLIPYKHLIAQYRPNLDNPWGSGIGERVYWTWFFKINALKIWLRFLERNTSPLKIARYTSEAQRSEIIKIMKRIGNDPNIAVPQDMGFEVHDISGAAYQSFLQFVDQYCDQQLAQAILGQTLTSATSPKGGGAYALGQVHNEVREDLRKADLMFVNSKLNEGKHLGCSVSRFPGLIPSILHYNYPHRKDIDVKIRLFWKKVKDKDKVLDRVIKIKDNFENVDIGVKWLRDYIEIPELNEDDIALVPKEQMGGMGSAGGLFARQVSNNNNKHFARDSDAYNAAETDKIKTYRNKIEEVKNNIVDNLFGDLQKIEAIKSRLQDPKWRQKKLPEFADMLNKLKIVAYVTGEKQMRRTIKEATQNFHNSNKTLEFADDYLSDELEVDYREELDWWAVNGVRDLEDVYWDKSFEEAQALIDAITDNINSQLRKGFSPEEVRKKLDQFAPQYTNTRIRTNLARVYDQSKVDNVEKNKELFAGWMYVTEQDNHVRSNHAIINNTAFALDDPALEKLILPFGYNCRCRRFPITHDDWKNDPKIQQAKKNRKKLTNAQIDNVRSF